ncbi:TraR/DksA C4-type zinc finger protein [bacterium]|nr:TraR/DksA C4-type zinc finger protein [bacterium]
MKRKIRCEICGAEIPSERLEILPDTPFCVKCSQIKPYSEAEALGFNNPEDQQQNGSDMEDFEDNENEFYP